MCAGGLRIVAAQQRTQFFVMLLLVLDHVLEDSDRLLVAQRFQLLAVTGDGPALLDLQPAQGHANTAGSAGQRMGIAARLAVVDRFGSAQLDDAPMPQRGMLPFGACQVAQNLGAHRIAVPVGQCRVGVEALHLGDPVAFERCQNLLQFGAIHRSIGHLSSLTFP